MKKNALLLFIIIALSILASFSVSFADGTAMEANVSTWVSGYNPTVLVGKGEGEKEPDTYFVRLPTADYHSNIEYKNGKMYVYQDGKSYQINPRITITESGKQPITRTGISTITKDGYPICVLDSLNDDAEAVDVRNAKVNVDFDIIDPNTGKTVGTVSRETSRPSVETVDEGFVDKIIETFGSIVGAIKDFVIDKLSQLFTTLLLNIADGIHRLIGQAVGENNITLQSIIFGKVDTMKINFWEKVADNENTPAGALKRIVKIWYGRFQTMGLAIYLAVLLYIAIKIMLTSTGKSKQKYKELLVNWFYGVIILFVFPYVMKYVVVINETVVQLIQDKGNEIKGAEAGGVDSNADVMNQIRSTAQNTHSFMLVFVYFIMLGQIIALIVTYYKRLFMIAFLITIFPIVATFNIYEKAVRGGNKTLTNWTKEYTTLVFVQLVHAVVYVVLIEGAYETFDFEKKGSNNFILYIICVLFLFRAEKIVKAIFNIKSGTGMIGDLAESGALMVTMASKTKNIFKPSKEENEEKEELEESENTVRQFNQQSAHRRMLEEERNAIYEARNTETTNTASSSSTDSSSQRAYVGAPPGLAPSDGTNPNTPSGGTPSTPVDVDASIGDGGREGLPEGGENGGVPDTVIIHAVDPTPASPKPERLSQTEIAKGAAVAKKLGLSKRSKASIIKKAVGAGGRVAGTSLGIATGLAQGDVKGAIDNAVTYGTVGSQLGTAAKVGVSAVERKVKAEKLKADIKSGKYDKEFKDVGIDPDTMSKRKAELFRKVMASYASGTTSGGTAKGELNMVKAIEKEAKKDVQESND